MACSRREGLVESEGQQQVMARLCGHGLVPSFIAENGHSPDEKLVPILLVQQGYLPVGLSRQGTQPLPSDIPPFEVEGRVRRSCQQERR